MYSDLYFRQKRSPVPAILAMVLAFGVIGFGIFYFASNSAQTRASKKTLVQREVVNLGASQAGIYWQSDAAETGWVIYGESSDKLDKTASDERDVEEKKKSFQLHYALLKGLKPDTTYYYRVVSGNEIVSDANGEPFTLKTISTAAPNNSAKPAYGKVAIKTGEPADGVLVFLRFKDAYPIVTVTKVTGEWLVPLQYIVLTASNQAITLNENDKFTIQAINDELVASKVDLIIKKSSPVPQTIVLGNNYTFTDTEEYNVLPASTSRKAENKAVSPSVAQEPVEETPKEEGAVRILFPKENAVIPGKRPLIKGTALPKAVVDLTLSSVPQFSFRTIANDRGEWMVSVPKDLPPQAYTLSLRTVDEAGRDVYMARAFTLAKSGEQVLAEATGPGEPTVEPTVAVPTVPVETPTEAPVTPTVAVTQAPAVTSGVSPTVAPTVVASGPTATPMPPITGNNGIFYTATAVVLLVVGAGVMFLF